MTSWWGCRNNDVMIAATLHWLLLPMWHANHLINSYVIGKSENQTLPKKNTRHVFMNEMDHFERSDRFELCVSGIQDGIHAHLACITYRRLENMAINFLQCRFMNPHDFNFLLELSKMYWVGDLARFWGRVGRVTGTKQLFCHSLTGHTSTLHSWSRIWFLNFCCWRDRAVPHTAKQEYNIYDTILFLYTVELEDRMPHQKNYALKEGRKFEKKSLVKF